jgi:hypothetical protein
MNYGAARLDIARAYVAEFERQFSEEFFPVKFNFKSLESPRECNFETDKIWCEISDAAARRIIGQARKSPNWLATIERRHKSRSGFISFYPHDAAHWSKPADQFDYHELTTALLALIGDAAEEYEDSAFYRIDESSYQLIEHIDYARLERLQRAELAREQLAAAGVESRYGAWDDDDALTLAPCIAGVPDVARVAEMLDSGVDVTAEAIARAPAPFDAPRDPRLDPRCISTPDMFGDSTNA